MTLDEAGRIIRAKIKLGHDKPFFAWLLSYMKLKEDNETCPTMGVDDKSNLYWNREFIKTLKEDELKGTLVHEVLHLCLSHPFRAGVREGIRDMKIANIAMDIVVNNILSNEGIPIPKSCRDLYPDKNTLEIKELKLKIEDIDKKTFEEVYDILIKKIPKVNVSLCFGIGKGDEGESKGKGIKVFDEHKFEGKGSDSKRKAFAEAQEKEWNKRLVEALTFAQMQGTVPAGMERLVGSLVNSKVSWKRLLNKYMTSESFSDYTWARPSRRSHSVGTYLPSSVKENVKVAVAIDTSGSIDQITLTQFLSEIVHIVRSCNNIKATIMECDAEINQEFEVRNGDIGKIMSMKVKGGGGTDFDPVMKRMLEKKRDIKLLVYLTDGFGNISYKKRDLPFEVIWVLTKDGTDENVKDIGRVIRMED